MPTFCVCMQASSLGLLELIGSITLAFNLNLKG